MNSQKELANKQYEESKNEYNMMQKKLLLD